MNYDKHTNEVIERLQAHQILEIMNTTSQEIGKALELMKELEHNATMYLDLRPTQEIIDDMNALHLHLHFLQSAKKFAKQEIKEVGFYLN